MSWVIILANNNEFPSCVLELGDHEIMRFIQIQTPQNDALSPQVGGSKKL